MRQAVPAVLALILACPHSGAASSSFLAGSSSGADSTVCRYAFPSPAICLEGDAADVSIAGLESWSQTGEPVLPVYLAHIIVPPGRKAASVVIKEARVETIPGPFVVRHGQEPVPLSHPERFKPAASSADIYGSDALYPAVAGETVSVQRKHGQSLLVIRLYPVRCRPKSGLLISAREMEIRVAWEADPAARLSLPGPAAAPTLGAVESARRRSRDIEDLSLLADNPAALAAEPSRPRAEPLGSAVLPTGDFEHVIITTEALLAAPPPFGFQALSEARIAQGMTSTNVTVEWIYTNYPGTRPAGGTDNQTRIRNFIADAYTNWGTRYVLLGGDISRVPARLFWVQASIYTDTMPSDMYYGCLDGSFDGDRDGNYGEPNDGPGEVDLAAEVYIGRAAVANTAEVARVVRKTLAYEQSATSHLARITMVGEHLGFGGVSEYGWPCMEQIRTGGQFDGYFTLGFENSAYSNSFDTSGTLYDTAGTSWDPQDLINRINGGVHVLNHLGHANSYYNMKLYTSDLNSLANTNEFFVYSQGCYPGSFDSADCYAEVMTTVDKGAFAVIMNARYGFGTGYSTDGPSHRYNRRFWHAAFNSGIFELGRMNQNSKEQLMAIINSGCMRWCYYELNLFGDPAAPFARQVVGGPPLISHTPLENTYVTNAPYDVDAVITPGSLLDTNTLCLSWNTDGSTNVFWTTNLAHVAKHLYRAQIPAQPRDTAIYYWLRAATLNAAASSHPAAAPATLHRFEVSAPFQMTVNGTPQPYGSVIPPYGATQIASGVVVNASASPHTSASEGTRQACAGWIGAGSMPSDGTTNAVSFTLAADSSITWLWVTQYSLAQTSSVSGILDTSTWWNAGSTGQTLTADAARTFAGTNYAFVEWQWNGARFPDATSPATAVASGVLATGACTAVAVYLPANQDANGDGLPDWWERHYFGTTAIDPDEDPDGDGFSNAEECRDGTNPRDPDDWPTGPTVTHTPLADPQNCPAPWTVSAVITDYSGVAEAVLQWRRLPQTSWHNVSMAASPTFGVYTTAIPAPGTLNQTFEYKIVATDSNTFTTETAVYRFFVAYPISGVSPTALTNTILPPSASTNDWLAITNSGNTTLVWRITLVPGCTLDDVESGTNGCTHSGAGDGWHITTNRASSGTHAWYCGSDATRQYQPSMHAVLQLPPVTLVTNATFAFRHWIASELDDDAPQTRCWDGGIVEISTNGGTSFARIAPVGDYPFQISGWEMSPWPDGTPCFAGNGEGWTNALFDLSAYGSRTVVLRFHFGSDDNTEREGWYVDDFTITPAAPADLWFQPSATNGVLAPDAATNLTITFCGTNMMTGGRFATLIFSNNSPADAEYRIPLAFQIRWPPAILVVSALQTSTNGAGLVTISNLVSDVDQQPCEVEVLYSTDGGAGWASAWISNAWSALGTPVVSNGLPCQVSNVVTTGGSGPATNSLVLLWATQHGSPILLCTDALVRVRTSDGLFWSPSVTSQPFMVDNQLPSAPDGLTSTSHIPSLWFTNAAFGATWNPASDGDGAGVAGYGWTLTNISNPLLPREIATVQPQAAVTVPADGTNWWFVVCALDAFGNASSNSRVGPYWVDTHAPDAAAATVTVAHSPFGLYTFAACLSGAWTGFTDSASGIAGYYFSLTNGQGTAGGLWTADATGTLTGVSANRTNFFYVWGRDQAGLIGLAACGSMLVLDAAEDYDGDGFSNQQEEIAGSDANNPLSVFALTGISPASLTNSLAFAVQWNSVTDRLYSLFFTNSLEHADDPWPPVPSFQKVPGTNGVMTYEVPLPPDPLRYYRLKVEPQ